MMMFFLKSVEKKRAALAGCPDGLCGLTSLLALEGERVAMLDAGLVEVVVAGCEAGIVEADGEIAAFLAVAFPCGSYLEAAREQGEVGMIVRLLIAILLESDLGLDCEGADVAGEAVIRLGE